jgi:hypothetical protein
MTDTLAGNAQYDAITAAIKAFPFWDYGLDEANPHSEYAEWVPDLAAAIHKAAAPAEDPTSTPDLTKWAADMAADDLEPSSDAITVDGDGKPIVRIHVAFRSDMSDRTRAGFMVGLGQALAEGF